LGIPNITSLDSQSKHAVFANILVDCTVNGTQYGRLTPTQFTSVFVQCTQRTTYGVEKWNIHSKL